LGFLYCGLKINKFLDHNLLADSIATAFSSCEVGGECFIGNIIHSVHLLNLRGCNQDVCSDDQYKKSSHAFTSFDGSDIMFLLLIRFCNWYSVPLSILELTFKSHIHTTYWQVHSDAIQEGDEMRVVMCLDQ